jgi:hypothetical protein
MLTARTVRLRVRGVWYAATAADLVSADGQAATVRFRRVPAPAPTTPTTHPEDTTMNAKITALISTVETLAKNVDVGAATEVINLIAAGVMAADSTIKPTFPADLINAFTASKAAYAGLLAVVADVKG